MRSPGPVPSFDASGGDSVARQVLAIDISGEDSLAGRVCGHRALDGGHGTHIARNIAATSTAANSETSNRVVSLFDNEHARSLAHRVCARVFSCA
jgi:hypothetical protein